MTNSVSIGDLMQVSRTPRLNFDHCTMLPGVGEALKHETGFDLIIDGST